MTETEQTTTRPRSRSLRAQWGIGLLSLAAIGTLALAWVPAPYVIETPGPVYNTLGSVEDANGKTVPFIFVTGTTTYPTSGELSMLTVYATGSPEGHPSWLEVASAWIRPDSAVIPMDVMYPAGTTHSDSVTAAQVQMDNSQQEAVAAALTHQGIPFDSKVVVAETTEGYPAADVVKVDDVILSANAVPIHNVSDLRAVIKEAGIGHSVELVVDRAGIETTLSVGIAASKEDGTTPVIGILCGGKYTFPFSVEIKLSDVGGSSAGMMFALGIIDTLTPGSLNGGANVAGTGEITADGLVGPIGGIVQKAYGARDSGATWLLVPKDNCADLVGHIPDGLREVSVSTLDDALAALHAIATHSGTTALPHCSAG